MFIPNKQVHDPLLADFFKKTGKYDGQKIQQAFLSYNMILFTTQGTIDTTVYNYCNYSKKQLDTGFSSAGSVGVIEFGYNPKPDAQGGFQKLDNAETTTEKYKFIEIPENTIYRVVIKSKRNFLPNQNPKNPNK